MKKTVRKTESGYPLMRYLSLLLVVALLFSGVTFARYALERNGSVNTGVALFDASYTVEGVNSLTFGNQSYWMKYSDQWYEQGEGSARTVRIGMQNKSDVNVRANVLHMEGPAEFWENIALQLTAVENNKGGVAAGQIITTQYVLADFLRVRQGGTTVDNETHGYTYGAYQKWGESGTFDTVFSDEFDQRDSVEETFSMSGGITAVGLEQIDTTSGEVTYDLSKVTDFSGTVTAVRTSSTGTTDLTTKPLTITITASMKTVTYSVGFARKQDQQTLPVFYLDCGKEVPYYSIDITLPDTEYFNMAAGNGTTSVIAFLTWTNSSGSSDLSTPVYLDDWKDIAPVGDSQGGTQDGIQDGTQDDTQDDTFNGATVTGYHFNYTDVPAQRTKEENEEDITEYITTTVRMNKTVMEWNEESETWETLDKPTIAWEHVASISSGDGVYAHPLELLELETGDIFYKCSGENPVTITPSDLELCNSSYNPSEFEVVQDSSGNYYSTATEKGYEVRFSVSFVQASEQP